MIKKNDIPVVLSDVDKEIHNLYEYCIAAGLSQEEILKKAQPLLQPMGKELLKKKYYSYIKIFGLCLIFGIVLSSDQGQRSTAMVGRQFLIKMLPIWDWTEIYHSSCFVYNPYFESHKISPTDCQTCEDLFEVDYLNATTEDEITFHYLQNDIPVIISGAMSDWPSMEDTFNILNISEGYLFSNELKDTPVCMLQTNLRVRSHQDFLHRILSSEFTKWYAHWENCFSPSVKFLRKFYNRPYFIPKVIQMSESNWLFASSFYSGTKFKWVNIDPSITLMWVAQIRGYHYIQLEAKSPCNETCNILRDVLQEGNIVLFNPVFWKFFYLPGKETENLAFATGGFSQIS